MVRYADEYTMKKDPFPPEGRGPAEKQSVKNNHGTKTTIKRGDAEWAKPLYQHKNKQQGDAGASPSIMSYPSDRLFLSIMFLFFAE